MLACIAFVASVWLHLRFAASSVTSFYGSTEGLRLEPNTFVFAGTGSLFLLLTIAAHVWTVRGLTPPPSERQGDNRPASPPAMLLIPMAIRFAGTFAILGGLLVWGSVERHEAVFDVLFWYVTLTTLEVVGIVWAFRSMRASETCLLASRPDTV